MWGGETRSSWNSAPSMRIVGSHRETVGAKWSRGAVLYLEEKSHVAGRDRDKNRG